MSESDIAALTAVANLHECRKGAQHRYAHEKCSAKTFGRTNANHRVWNEKDYKDFLAVSEALMFDDIGRCHGFEVQDSLRSTLSEAGRNELVNTAFLHGARNRSDDRLDRTSSALLATLHEKVGDDDVFRTIACVVAANNADVFASVLDLLTLGSFDMDAMCRKIRQQ